MGHTYREPVRNAAFPHLRGPLRPVAWFATGSEQEDEGGAFVFAASERAARARGTAALGFYDFPDVRVTRLPSLDDLDDGWTPRDVIERGCGFTCDRCDRMVRDHDEPHFDEHGLVASCATCREDAGEEEDDDD